MTVACKIEPAYAVESKALADYDHLLGRVVLTTKISGYVGSDSVSLNLSTPAKVQITATDQASLLHWNDDWCDPYWNVTLVEPHVELDGVRSLWMDGHSYHINGKQSEASDFTLA